MQSLESFIRRERIRFECDYADSNPNMLSDDEWMATASHYRCILKKGRKVLTVPFSQGSGIPHEPTAADVLDCLASDASGLDSARTFEEWCAEYGFDTDSRKSEKTYRIIERQAEALKAMLGPEAYETLLYKTERL